MTEKEEAPSSSVPPRVEDEDKRSAKRQARGEDGNADGKSIKPSPLPPTTTSPSIVPAAATRLAAVYSVHRPDSSIFKRGGMKREAPAELAATNERAKRKQQKKEKADAAAADAAAASAAAAAAATEEEPQEPQEPQQEDDAATLRRRLSELRDAWAAPRRGRGLSGAAWVAEDRNKKTQPPRVARVAPARSKLAPRMGFHHRGLQYLHPEEAAFLVDRGDLVLAVGVVVAAKKQKEEEEDGEPAAVAATTTTTATARPPRPSYPPPPPAALDGDVRSARALSVQESMSLALSSGVPSGALQLYSHLMRAGYVVRRSPAVWYLDAARELGEAWGMGRGWKGGGGGGGGGEESDEEDDEEDGNEERGVAAAGGAPSPSAAPPSSASSSLIPLTASEVRKAKRARAAVDAKMERLYGTSLEGRGGGIGVSGGGGGSGGGASWEALKRKKQEDKRRREQGGQKAGEEGDGAPRSRQWWPAPGAPGSWLPPSSLAVEGDGRGAEAVPAAAAAAAPPSSLLNPSFTHAPPGLLRLRPFPETPPSSRSSSLARRVLSASAPAFAVHRCSAAFARRRPAAPASVARLAPRAGPSAAPLGADALAAAEGEAARDAREAARVAAAEAAAAEAKKKSGGGGGGGRALAPASVPVVRWAVPRSGGVSYFGFHRVRLAHI